MRHVLIRRQLPGPARRWPHLPGADAV